MRMLIAALAIIWCLLVDCRPHRRRSYQIPCGRLWSPLEWLPR